MDKHKDNDYNQARMIPLSLDKQLSFRVLEFKAFTVFDSH
jgi:hypothetical protein